MAITQKRRVFIEAYLKDWNATEAARVADYAHPGSQGHRLLKNVEIQEEIQRRLDEKCMGADEVLLRLAEQARADISGFITDHGAVDWEAVRERGHLIKKVAHSKGKNSTIELHDAQAALALIGKHHRLFVDRQEITGKDGAPIEVEIKEVIVELPPENEPMADSE
ncbi:MAG: terminase small subunit [Dehalococcoidales bacterium]